MGSFGSRIEGCQAWRLLCVTAVALAAFACAQATQQAGSAPAQTPPAAGAGAETAKPAPPATQKPATPAAAAGQKPAAPAAGQKPTPDQAKPPAKPMMATSADKTQIAYETGGTGPALVLVQGAGESRRSWQERGYGDRLRKQFTMITFDRRGTGDSGKPMGVDAYNLDNVLADITAVADAASAKRFYIWGFGDGATIVRHYATKFPDRVISAVIVGATMGPAVTGITKDAITAMRAKWKPLVDANAAGKLDVKAMSPGDRAAWENGVAISALSLGALLDFPAVEPADIKVPTLWLVGAEDEGVKENIKAYEGKVKGTSVTLKTLSSLSYSDTFIKADVILPEVESFLLKNKPTQ